MTDTRIAEFEVGRPVEGVFAVVSKQRRHDRNGDAYLVFELTDQTGSIEGRLWRNADWFDQNISEGDHVRTIGRATQFRDTMQLDIRRMDRLGDDDPATAVSFVPEGRRSLDDLSGELDFLIDEVEDAAMRQLLDRVWNGPQSEQLRRSPATRDQHHAFLGGLVQHTVTVASLCMTAAERHPSVNRDLLLTAALVHDIGRARELSVEDAIAVTPVGELYGHLLLGHEMLLTAAGALVDEAWWPELVHAVSHHHDSPERSRTREGAVLAAANALDVKLAARG